MRALLLLVSLSATNASARSTGLPDLLDLAAFRLRVGAHEAREGRGGGGGSCQARDLLADGLGDLLDHVGVLYLGSLLGRLNLPGDERWHLDDFLAVRHLQDFHSTSFLWILAASTTFSTCSCCVTSTIFAVY